MFSQNMDDCHVYMSHVLQYTHKFNEIAKYIHLQLVSVLRYRHLFYEYEWSTQPWYRYCYSTLLAGQPKKIQRAIMSFLSFSFILSRALCLALGRCGHDGGETLCAESATLSAQPRILPGLVWVQESAAGCKLCKSPCLVVQLKRS